MPAVKIVPVAIDGYTIEELRNLERLNWPFARHSVPNDLIERFEKDGLIESIRVNYATAHREYWETRKVTTFKAFKLLHEHHRVIWAH